MTISLSTLEKLAREVSYPTDWVSTDFIDLGNDTATFIAACSPETILTLVRIARAAILHLKHSDHDAIVSGNCIKAHFIGAACDCGYDELMEALKEVSK